VVQANLGDNEVVDYLKLMEAKAEDFEELAKKVRFRLVPKLGRDYKVYLEVKPELREGEELITYTHSSCPYCNSILNAVIFKREDKVWIRKICPQHGEIEEVYWGDYDLYVKFRRWQEDGKGIDNPQLPLTSLCPFNCGLCPRHKSHPALVNIVLTNRCDLGCWYCFFYSERAGYVYEPTIEHLKYMIKVLKETSPIPVKAVQLTGGEPTLRDDLVDIVKMIKAAGITHVQVNTHAIRLAFEPELVKELREAGTNVLYVSFDGVTPYTNPKNHWEIPYTLENCKKVGLGVVLVPTIIRGFNDHELGTIINFALKHLEVIRGVNFQPVSLTGRMPREEREKYRITIPDAIKLIEEQTGGDISKDDWYPVPSVAPISHLVEGLTGVPQFTLTNHFACGAATYVFKDGNVIIPITRFIRVGELLAYLRNKALELAKGANKYLVMLKVLSKLNSFIEWDRTPSTLRKRRTLLRLLYKILVKHDYSSLGEFHYKTLFVGMMHFQDLYNHDVARVQRCNIFYITPDGRLVPFCSFNVLPDIYRDRVQRAYGIPLSLWEERTGLKVKDYKYRRNVRKLINGDTYRRYYEGVVNLSSIDVKEHILASKRFGIPVTG